jgi:predicted metal-binding transcription factor (methanogenesis marker protein 9)
MNKILIEVSVGELLDKISILEIKKEKIKDLDKLKFINDEYLILKKQLDENITLNDELKKLYEELKAINTKLWDIEDN